MKKITEYLSDSAVVIGCCMGVGMLSGKEAQVFFGNTVNIIIFAVTFFAVNFLFREYCRQKQISSTAALSNNCFKKLSPLFGVIFSTCCFVCVTTMLAGVNECLNCLLPVNNLPLYGIACACISAIVLSKGLNALKIANVISIALAVILIVILFLTGEKRTNNIDVPPSKPVVYALFSITMSFGILTELGAKSSRRRNVICSAIASVTISAIMVAVLCLCDFSRNLPTIENITNPYLLTLTAVTLLLATVTGIVANAMPIVEQIESVIPDKPLCCSLVFALALTLSMFGFDFVIKIGYLIVGVVGALTLITMLVNLLRSKSRRTNGVLPR